MHTRSAALFALLLALSYALPAAAQTTSAPSNVTGGATLGVNWTQITIPTSALPDEVETVRERGLSGGVWAQMSMGSGAFARVEGLYTQKGGALLETQTFSGDTLELRARIRLNYFEIPILAGWQSSGDAARISVFAGPTLGVFLSSSSEVTSVELNGEDVSGEFAADIRALERELAEGTDDAFKRLDLGLTIGAGVEMGRLSLNARYTFGLRDVTKELERDDDDNTLRSEAVKNRSFAVMVGVRFR